MPAVITSPFSRSVLSEGTYTTVANDGTNEDAGNFICPALGGNMLVIEIYGMRTSGASNSQYVGYDFAAGNSMKHATGGAAAHPAGIAKFVVNPNTATHAVLLYGNGVGGSTMTWNYMQDDTDDFSAQTTVYIKAQTAAGGNVQKIRWIAYIIGR